MGRCVKSPIVGWRMSKGILISSDLGGRSKEERRKREGEGEEK